MLVLYLYGDGKVVAEQHMTHCIDLWKKMWKVWDMKRHYWSLLKACWLKSGWRRGMLMVHQWMHPDKVNMRYDALYVQKYRKKNYIHQFDLICLQTVKHAQKQTLWVNTLKAWFQSMEDDMKIRWDESTASLFFNFTFSSTGQDQS